MENQDETFYHRIESLQRKVQPMTQKDITFALARADKEKGEADRTTIKIWQDLLELRDVESSREKCESLWIHYDNLTKSDERKIEYFYWEQAKLMAKYPAFQDGLVAIVH